MSYVIKDFECEKCGVTERMVESGISQIICCGKTAVALISAPMVIGADSFNAHFDITQGQYFATAEQKKAWLAGKNKEQVEGSLSPRNSKGGRFVCSDVQARKFKGLNAKKIRNEDLTNRRTSVGYNASARS